MPKTPRSIPDPNRPTTRDETPAEFSRRVQDQMDQDSWQGVDTVGACYPTPAKIVEIDSNDSPRVIYKRREGQ